MRVVVAPIGRAGDTGVIVAGSLQAVFPGEEDLLLLGAVAKQAAISLRCRNAEQARLQLQRERDELQARLRLQFERMRRGNQRLPRHHGTQTDRGGSERLGRSSPFERLTPRQRDVLHLVAEGNSSKEIARTLTLSVKTVEMHRTQLMAALDIHDIAGLVRYAIRIGLISPEI